MIEEKNFAFLEKLSGLMFEEAEIYIGDTAKSMDRNQKDMIISKLWWTICNNLLENNNTTLDDDSIAFLEFSEEKIREEIRNNITSVYGTKPAPNLDYRGYGVTKNNYKFEVDILKIIDKIADIMKRYKKERPNAKNKKLFLTNAFTNELDEYFDKVNKCYLGIYKKDFMYAYVWENYKDILPYSNFISFYTNVFLKYRV